MGLAKRSNEHYLSQKTFAGTLHSATSNIWEQKKDISAFIALTQSVLLRPLDFQLYPKKSGVSQDL